MQEVEFQVQQRFWQRAFQLLYKKMSRLEQEGIRLIKLLSPYINTATGYVQSFYINLCSNQLSKDENSTFYNIIPPYKYFTPLEIVVQQNMVAQNIDLAAKYIELLGLAEFWPKDYDFDKHGFGIPSEGPRYKIAFILVFAIEREAQYKLIFPSNSDLQLMDNTLKARFIQQSMLQQIRRNLLYL